MKETDKLSGKHDDKTGKEKKVDHVKEEEKESILLGLLDEMDVEMKTLDRLSLSQTSTNSTLPNSGNHSWSDNAFLVKNNENANRKSSNFSSQRNSLNRTSTIQDDEEVLAPSFKQATRAFLETKPTSPTSSEKRTSAAIDMVSFICFISS